MQTEMIELIYYSVASPSLTKADVSDILGVSQKNNSRKDITGCLLYYSDAFIQILEGDPKVIESIFAKIEEDNRHYNVRRVYEDIIQQRLFKDWSMAFYDLDKGDTVNGNEVKFRKDFLAIAGQTEQHTVAGKLFWDISRQLLTD